jgi:hypothetical protein
MGISGATVFNLVPSDVAPASSIAENLIDYISPPEAITGLLASGEDVVKESTYAHVVAIHKSLTFLVMMTRKLFICLYLKSICFMLKISNH